MKKEIDYYIVDAFADTLFKGNTAGVCVLKEELDFQTMLSIAKENALPETAFVVPTSEKARFKIKWFTPEIEMDLCGHATLASAFILFNFFEKEVDCLIFESLSGELKVTKDKQLITLDFPSRNPSETNLPEIIGKALGVKPIGVYKSRDYFIEFENETIIKNLKPDEILLKQINLEPGGIIVTSKGDQVDFVSRFFTPNASIFEDPVTGSAHCSLIPFWSQKLQKKKMTAKQLSQRGGVLYCTDEGERVRIGGKCVLYLSGTILI